jgi:hypothetical protein
MSVRSTSRRRGAAARQRRDRARPLRGLGGSDSGAGRQWRGEAAREENRKFDQIWWNFVFELKFEDLLMVAAVGWGEKEFVTRAAILISNFTAVFS